MERQLFSAQFRTKEQVHSKLQHQCGLQQAFLQAEIDPAHSRSTPGSTVSLPVPEAITLHSQMLPLSAN